MYGNNCNLRTLSREYDCLAKTALKRSRCYWETMSPFETSKGNMRRLELTIKDKNI